jgi:hypothetical protein
MRMIDMLVGLPLVWMILWAGLASLTIALLVLMRTRWGQSRPLRKCTVLSLLAHAMLGCFFTTVKIVSVSSGPADDDPISISLASGDSETQQVALANRERESSPWDSPAIRSEAPPAQPPERITTEEDALAEAKPKATSPAEIPSQFDVRQLRSALPLDAAAESVPAVSPTLAARPQATKLDAPAAEKAEAKPVETPAATPERAERSTEESPAPTRKSTAAEAPEMEIPLAPRPSSVDVALGEQLDTKMVPVETSISRLASMVPPAAVVEEALVEQSNAIEANSDTPARDAESLASVAEARSGSEDAPEQVDEAPTLPGAEQPFQLPTIYEQRFAHDRLETVRRHGGGPETEAAVESALRWLAANQEADGHWDANRHGAGKETLVLGHDRQRAGVQANTGMTALAVLAFMGAGNTHEKGQFNEQVRQGLQYLLNSQARDGNLAGEATLFARMYCHGMAAFALAEAYAMTGDDRLQPAVQAAVQYTIRAQRKNSGGWRYQPGDLGDTSQTGWQLMALRSAEICGETMPGDTRADAQRFLRSVSSGQFGGLASYRPHHQVSRSMTAEAMYCRQLIGDPISPQAGREAAIYLLGELPGRGEMNLYYWYYGTLCLYFQQGEAWERWNAALKETLLKSQLREGDGTGSWNATTVWGGYGGRVYCTSMAAMNLEIYYRFLPIHIEQARRRQLVR